MDEERRQVIPASSNWEGGIPGTPTRNKSSRHRAAARSIKLPGRETRAKIDRKTVFVEELQQKQTCGLCRQPLTYCNAVKLLQNQPGDEKKLPAPEVPGVWNRSLAVSYFHMGSPTLSSALNVFTSEFGMGSGGSRSLWLPGKLVSGDRFIDPSSLTIRKSCKRLGISS